MTPEEVPADLVEKAARAMYEANSYRVQGSNSFGLPVGARLPWKHLLPSDSKKLRSEARHGLAAVLPEYAATVLEEAAVAVESWPEWSSRQDYVRFLLFSAADLRAANKETP